MNKWKCECGYINDGGTAPDECPKCGAGSEKFTLLEGMPAGLVERSRHANTIHCRLVSFGRKIEELCRSGIEDDLDPGCVEVFRKTLDHSYEIMKLSMTEMQGHIGKGKWG